MGESVDIALRRETQEELGITDFMPEKLTSYIFESTRERELVFVHKTIYDGEIHPSDELNGGRFWSLEEIKENLGKEVFTPNFEGEIEKSLRYTLRTKYNSEMLSQPIMKHIVIY